MTMPMQNLKQPPSSSNLTSRIDLACSPASPLQPTCPPMGPFSSAPPAESPKHGIHLSSPCSQKNLQFLWICRSNIDEGDHKGPV
jgi:hypothetical protein